MTSHVEELEQEIEASRARLDRTLNRLQGRLNASGVVDEVIGTVGRSDAGPTLDRILSTVRSNPIPVGIIAAGVGWLCYRLVQDEHRRLDRLGYEQAAEETVSVLNTGNARVYDPDHSPRHPAQDLVETRREASARA